MKARMRTVYDVVNAGEPGAEEKIRTWFARFPLSDTLLASWVEHRVFVAVPLGQQDPTPMVVKPEEFYDFFEDVHDGSESPDDLMADFERALAAAPTAHERGLTPEQQILAAIESWPDDERTRQVRSILAG